MIAKNPAKAPNPARKHHFLPEFYLRYFRDSTGRVLSTWKDPNGKLREKPLAPGGLGYEHDLYSLQPEIAFYDPPRPDDIEANFFQDVDSDAAPVMKRLVDGAPSDLDDDERRKWARFVNSLTERHPQRLRERDAHVKEILAQRRESFIATGPSEESQRRRREVLKDLMPGFATNIVRGAMVAEIDRGDVIAHFHGATWLKIHLDEPSELPIITGDHPVVSNAGNPWPIQFLSLALTPNDLFFLYRDTELPDVETIVNIVRVHGRGMLRQCEYVYSREALFDGKVLHFRKDAENEMKPSPWRK